MTCPDADKLLAGSREVDDHVASCSRCASALASVAALREGIGTHSPRGPSVDRVMESIRAEKERESRRTMFGAASTFVLVLATALPVLAAALATFPVADGTAMRRAAVVAVTLAAVITLVEPRWMRG